MAGVRQAWVRQPWFRKPCAGRRPSRRRRPSLTITVVDGNRPRVQQDWTLERTNPHHDPHLLSEEMLNIRRGKLHLVGASSHHRMLSFKSLSFGSKQLTPPSGGGQHPCSDHIVTTSFQHRLERFAQTEGLACLGKSCPCPEKSGGPAAAPTMPEQKCTIWCS